MRDEKPLAEEAAAEACAPVALAKLVDSRYHGLFPPRTRMYLYLQIKTRGGRDPIRLTDAMAVELGLYRGSKATCLHQLEAAGVVRVTRDQLLSPLVEWCDRLV